MEQESKKRAALGTSVWRMADGSDALYEDCVGPSAYWKAQGFPVRVWGVLANGVLYVSVLKEGQVMNRANYKWLLEQRFPCWLRSAFGEGVGTFLVQDHERCLWISDPHAATKALNIERLDMYYRLQTGGSPQAVSSPSFTSGLPRVK